MKKIKKIASIALAGALLLSTVPAISVSAATTKKKPNVTTENTSKGIKISWKKVAKNAKYTISRSTKKATGYKILKTTKSLTYTDKTAKGGKTYYYRVKSSTGKKYNAVRVMRLNAPTLKSATVDEYGDVDLKWTKVSGAKRYKIYRAKVTNGKIGKYRCIDWDNKSPYWDWLWDSGTYRYKITAVNGKYESVMSNSIKLTYMESSSIQGEINEDRTAINLTFDLIKDVDGYIIFRYEENAKNDTLVKLANIKAKDVVTIKEEFLGDVYEEGTYTDTTVEYGKSYIYGIQVYKGKTYSNIYFDDYFPIEYNEADIVLTVGETFTELAKAYEESTKDMTQEEIESEIGSMELAIEDTTIATIDEKYNITGLKAGKTNLLITVSYSEYGTTMTLTTKASVLVKEAVAPETP